MSSSSHKGSSGRIGVLGGSARYTGAPYYAAMASLKVGADLAFVFCAEEAAVPIKCYSPELMVASVYNAAEFDRSVRAMADAKSGELVDMEAIEKDQERLVNKMVSEVTTLFDRMHVLIIGPGLGRCPLVLKATAKIISLAKERNLPLVIDADGLHLLTLEENADLVADYEGVVLTPNAVEIKRLTQTLGRNYAKIHPEGDLNTLDGEELSMTSFDRATAGNIIVKKGHHDILFTITGRTHTQDRGISVKRGNMLCEEEGGLKRSGGLGDILSGCVGAFVAWNRILSRQTNGMNLSHEDLLLSCWSACCVTKKATRVAFMKKRRSMTAPDVLEEIGPVVDKMTDGITHATDSAER
eukprot:CAMPEP_0183323930 /NCGR_PEP_ID=MMETSP0160_2-20130417/75676_1 /TAXON_ID=2839 ORGANISM="Odontella Sinensis, Strain Grunow 1884" /NCGR_SAMPLE_ID=MMETSP0160_2 /ASSEMBLY_ACC=CAM_ASM_000250 /LENGTH=354 /DNA_ID=CAMNT_0025491387 /DNA_START=385 /DNA_END=1449 /DNA_ORIENTATION=+